MQVIIWLLYAALTVYVMLDAVSTKILLEFGAIQLNPLYNWLITVTGTVYSIYVAKMATMLFLFVLLVIYFDSFHNKLEVKDD